MRSLRERLKVLRYVWHEEHNWCPDEEGNLEKHFSIFLIRYSWINLTMGFKTWLCSKRGHQWEDHGYATPDSGCIDMVCSRCGYSAGRHILY